MTREELNEEKQEEIFKEENKEKTKNIIKTIIKSITIITIFAIGFFAYTTYISTARIHVREYRIINQNIPENFNGLKIIQFSDLHLGSTMEISDLNRIIKKINERNPDIVIYTGDLINKNKKYTTKEQETIINKLKKINAKLGKYAVLGNEDNDSYNIIMNQSGFNVLKNEYDFIYNNSNTPILLIGLSSRLKNEQDINKAFSYFKQETHNSNIYTITIVHEPDSIEDIVNQYNNTQLVLAGHSHNGNIRIPFINYSFTREKGAQNYYKDYYKINDTELYISSGIGTNNSSGIRLFCRPSISLYRLSNK